MAQEAMQLSFADGEYNFKITLSGINEIQSKCDAGIGAVWSRLAASRLNYIGEDVGIPSEAKFRIQDIVEPIRQALIGGGEGLVDGEAIKVNALVANRLIENYVLAKPLQESWSLAYAIIGGLVEGYDPPKKKVAENPTPTDDSTTPEPSPTAP